MNLETEVLELEENGIALLDKQLATQSVVQMLKDEYGHAFEAYTADTDLPLTTTVNLNAHGGDLYWYVTVNNDYYGGYVAEINAVSGECNYVDQAK